MLDKCFKNGKHDHAVHALPQVFVPDANQVQVSPVILFHGMEEVDEAKWKKVAPGFLQGFGEGWEGYSKCNHTVIFVQNNRDEINVCKTKI